MNIERAGYFKLLYRLTQMTIDDLRIPCGNNALESVARS